MEDFGEIHGRKIEDIIPDPQVREEIVQGFLNQMGRGKMAIQFENSSDLIAGRFTECWFKDIMGAFATWKPGVHGITVASITFLPNIPVINVTLLTLGGLEEIAPQYHKIGHAVGKLLAAWGLRASFEVIKEGKDRYLVAVTS